MAITEPDAGSDVASVSTAAIKDHDEYVITGNKVFITNCTVADFLVVLCVTNPDHPKKHERFSTIIVETNRPGYEANPFHGKSSSRKKCSESSNRKGFVGRSRPSWPYAGARGDKDSH